MYMWIVDIHCRDLSCGDPVEKIYYSMGHEVFFVLVTMKSPFWTNIQCVVCAATQQPFPKNNSLLPVIIISTNFICFLVYAAILCPTTLVGKGWGNWWGNVLTWQEVHVPIYGHLILLIVQELKVQSTH